MYSVVLLLAASAGGEAPACGPVFFPCAPVWYPCLPVCLPCPPVIFRTRVVVPACPTVVVRPVLPVVTVPQVKVDLIKTVLDVLTGDDDPPPIPKARLKVGVKGKALLKVASGLKALLEDDEEDEAPRVQVKARVKAEVAAPCTIVARVPVRARLYIDGSLCRSTSATRTFVSPPLQPGRTFHYKVRVEFERDGETVSVNRTVKVSAGATTKFTIGGDDE